MTLTSPPRHAIKAVSPRLSIGGPATMELLDVSTFLASLEAWGLAATAPDFVSSHSYPTDACNAAHDARSRLDCFTDGVIAAREQAAGHTFLMTEFNCGWRNNAIHDGESKAYAASFMLRTVNVLRLHDVSALSWWPQGSGALSLCHHRSPAAPDSLTYSVPLFLKRQCDSTLGGPSPRSSRRAALALDVAVILTPPCIFH